MRQASYNTFRTEANSGEQRTCRVCGALCDVTRNVYRPTGFVSAMAKHFTYHDAFACPHSEEAWHDQALKLAMSIDETPSKRVVALIRADLDELLAEHLH